ncbi:uncharacterized protein METZ01_LOCUS272644, partial [marine metagenome]
VETEAALPCAHPGRASGSSYTPIDTDHTCGKTSGHPLCNFFVTPKDNGPEPEGCVVSPFYCL